MQKVTLVQAETTLTHREHVDSATKPQKLFRHETWSL